MSKSTELAPMESFMDKVKAKLRDDIGALLPDEAVAQMVEKVIADEFFTKRHVPKPGRSYSSNETVEEPSTFQRMVIDAAKPIIERHVLAVMESRAAEIEAQIAEAAQAGLTKYAMAAMDKVFAQALQNQSWGIEDIIRRAIQEKRL